MAVLPVDPFREVIEWGTLVSSADLVFLAEV
jgi:hypothetical protein